MEEQTLKFWQKQWFTWLTLILCPLVGIIILWACNKTFDKKKKSVLTFIFVVWFLILCGTNNSKTTTTEQPKPVQQEEQIQTTQTQKAVEKKQNDEIIVASVDFANSLTDILNHGYEIADKSKVYYTKSKDFSKVYFVGTLIKQGSQYYNAIWVTNDITRIGAGIVFSANDYAVQVSGMGDARTNAEPITEHDDGYSRINGKVLDDMYKAIN